MFLACLVVLIVDAVLQLSPLLGAVTVVSMTLLLLAFVLWLSSPGGLGTRGGWGAAGEGHAPSTFSRNARPMPHAPMPPSIPPDAPRGSFLGGLLCQLCLSHQGPLGHAWLGTPGAPGHVCRGQPWSPRSPASRLPWGRSSRSIARSPPPLGAWLPRPGARPPLCPPPCHSTLQRRAGSRAAPRSRPHQTHPLRPCPLITVTHGCARAAPPDPPDPRNVRRHPPPAAPGARGPRPPAARPP